MSFETALATVQGAYRTAPHGAARAMLEHLISYAEGREPDDEIEWYAGEAIFARLVIDDRWSIDDARGVYHAVRELAVTAPAHRSRTRSDIREVRHG